MCFVSSFQVCDTAKDGTSQRKLTKQNKLCKEALREEKTPAKYWLGDAGKKLLTILSVTWLMGKRIFLDPKGETILSAFEDYDIMLNLILLKRWQMGLYDQSVKLFWSIPMMKYPIVGCRTIAKPMGLLGSNQVGYGRLLIKVAK